MSKAGERLIEAAKEAVLLSKQIAQAEQRGYRRGVKDARDAMRYSASGMTVEQHAAILALLEPTEDSNKQIDTPT